jgi:serine/threonine protein kinase
MTDDTIYIGQRLGNYRIIRTLGKGAFATVYLGEHVYLQTQAAIKVLSIELVSDTLESFLTEARTIAHLRHPSIIGLLEFGVDRSTRTPFLVMEYAPNGSLRQRYPQGTRLPPALIVSYVKQITTGLQYAHDEKLIHRDIKPENLLLGADNEVLLADFNIALIAQTQYQKTQEIAGTPMYMAPEQLQGKATFASDQYALGIIVYEWLCGSCPFQGPFIAIASQHAMTPPPSLRAKIPAIPPAVEQVVMTALAKTPQQRFASVQDFSLALEQAYHAAISPPTRHPISDPLILAPTPTAPDQEVYQVATEKNPLQLASTIPPRLPLAPTQPALPFGHRQHNSAVSKIIMGIMLVLLLLSGSGLLYYFAVIQPAKQRIHTTATASASIDSRTKLYLAAISGNTVLNDALNHNDATTTNWVENTSSPDGKTCAFRDGAYYATALQQGLSPCLVQGSNFSDLSDFAYQVQMTIIQGNEGGLVFRSDAIDPNHYPFSTNYYLFSVGSDGHYSLSYQNTKNLVSLKRDTSSAIQVGLNNPNLLTVIAHGNTIILYINKKYVTTVSDHSRSSGLIGVFAQKNSHDTDIAFRNAQAWDLTGQSLPV